MVISRAEKQARSWKLPEKFSDVPTGKYHKHPSQEEIPELLKLI